MTVLIIYLLGVVIAIGIACGAENVKSSGLKIWQLFLCCLLSWFLIGVIMGITFETINQQDK